MTESVPHDFIDRITAYPTEEATKERFDEVLERMKSHEGQFVLMVTRNWEPTLFDAPRTRNDYMIEENTFLGIVKKPFIKDSNQTFEIVSKNHIKTRNRFNQVIELQKGNIKPPFYTSKYDLERPLEEQGYFYRHETGVALKIVVGDQAVMDYFDDKAWHKLKISKSDREQMQSTRHKIFDEYREGFYEIRPMVTLAKMAKKIGRPLPELPEGVEKEINREKMQIIEKLIELSKHGKDSHREVKSTIAQAFELDMHTDQIVITEELQPGIKTEINVQQFIKGICQRLEIPIPTASG